MRLPIPITVDGKKYTEVEVDAPKASAIADTRRDVEKVNVYQAIWTFIAGGVRCYIDEAGNRIEDQSAVKRITGYMPYRSAEYIALMVVLEIDPDDGIEGLYSCPRCGMEIVNEYVDEGLDTRDHARDLPVAFMEPGEEPIIDHKMVDPISIIDKTTGDQLFTIDSFKMEYPTLMTCAQSYNKYGATDEVRRQFAFYIDSLIEVNGEAVTQKFKGEWGMFLFSNMSTRKNSDRHLLNKAMQEYGLDSRIKKVCPKCDKEWNAEVSTANFFEYALRSE
ncbi:MAG: hypothetical protein GF388_05985 [Candidatus Aegiribacteria sp.]|nr:hypothetical protein [Candidatus Aegiribacteria sp.]